VYYAWFCRFYAFLQYVYKQHPPKTDKKMEEGLDRNDDNALRKACLNAVRDYHTDKSYNKGTGMEWYVLCEEIVKELNSFNAYFKAL